MKLKDRFKKLRLAFIYPIGIFAVLFFNSDDKSLRTGIVFIVIGFLIRIWANGYAIKMDKLTTSGPYAFVQHPLYLGTMLVTTGFAIMLNTSYLGVLFMVIVAVVYNRTIKKEEKMLKDKFKEIYLDYKKSVPPILPKLIPYRKGEKWKFSFKRLVRSKEHKAILWVIILIIIIHLKGEFMVEHESVNSHMWYLIIAAFIFWAIDLIEEFTRYSIETSGRGETV